MLQNQEAQVVTTLVSFLAQMTVMAIVSTLARPLVPVLALEAVRYHVLTLPSNLLITARDRMMPCGSILALCIINSDIHDERR